MSITETITLDAGPAIGELDAFAAAADKAAAAMDRLKTGGASGASLDKLGASLDAAAARIDAASQRMAAAMGRLSTSANRAAAPLREVGVAAGEAGAGLDRAAAGADASAAAMDRQAAAASRAGRATREASAGHEAFWKGVKVLAVGGAVAAVYGIDKAMKLQTEVTRLYTAAGLTGVKPGAVTSAVLGIGSKTGFTGQQIAQAMYHPVSAGLDWKTAQGLTTQAANLANIHGANLEDTAYSLSSVMKAYNQGAKEVIPTAALLNSIVGKGDMHFQDFNESIKNWAPTGAAMGISIQSMGAALAYLTDRGNSAEVASTRLTMGLSMMTSPTKAANTYLSALGLTTGKVALKNETLAKVMNKAGLSTVKLAADLRKPDGIYHALMDVHKAFTKAGMSGDQANQVMAKIFGGGRSDKAIMSLMQNLEGVRQKYQQIGQGVRDYGGDIAKEQATAQQHWKNFTASAQNLATAFGTQLLPAFTKMTGFATGLLQNHAGAVGGLLGGGMALFAGNKLVHGAGAAFNTGASLLRGVGKVSEFLHIPGLDKLANIGKAGGIEAAMISGGRAAGAEIQAAMVAGGRAAAAEMDAGVTAGGRTAGAAAAAEEGAAAGGIGAKIGSAAGAAIKVAAALAISKMLIDHLENPHNRKVLGNTNPSSPWNQWESKRSLGGMAVRFLAHQNTPTYGPLQGRGGGGPPPLLIVPHPAPAPSSATPMLGVGGHPFTAKIQVDTSAVSAARGKVQAAMGGITQILHGFHPAKIPAPDTSALEAAKGKAKSAGEAITQGVQSALRKPVKAAKPDISAYRAAIGPARTDGAQISAGLAAGIEAGKGAVVAAAADVANAAAAAMAKAAIVRSPSEKTKKTGKGLADGLVVGLEGGKAAVDAAAQAMGRNAAKAMDIATIDATAKKLLAEVPKGDSGLVRMLRADHGKLVSLANQRARLEQEIQDSQQIAKTMIGSASIMNAPTAVAYNPASQQSAAGLVTGMGIQAGNLKLFAQQVTQLKKMGLNATSLDQIIQAGPDQGLAIAQGLTSGGKGSIQQINQLEKQILAASGKIGDVGGPAMYQAGADAGKAAAKGLRSQLGEVEAAMKQLAQAMVSAIRHAAGHGGHGGHVTHHHHHTTHVHVQGHVTAEHDLVRVIQERVLTNANSNWQTGWRLPGRAA